MGIMSAKLGESLLKDNLITPQQLKEALDYQRLNGGRLASTLVKLGMLSDEEVTAVLSRQYGVPSVNLELFEVDPAAVALVPQETSERYSVLPLSRVGATLTLAMVDPTNVFAIDDIKFMTGLIGRACRRQRNRIQLCRQKILRHLARDGTCSRHGRPRRGVHEHARLRRRTGSG